MIPVHLTLKFDKSKERGGGKKRWIIAKIRWWTEIHSRRNQTHPFSVGVRFFGGWKFFCWIFFFKSEVALEKTSKIIEHIIQTQHFVAFDFTISRNFWNLQDNKHPYEKSPSKLQTQPKSMCNYWPWLRPERSGPGVTDWEWKGRLALLRIELQRLMRQEEGKCIDAGMDDFFLKFDRDWISEVAKMISELTYHGVFFESFFRRNRENIMGKYPTLVKECSKELNFHGHCHSSKVGDLAMEKRAHENARMIMFAEDSFFRSQALKEIEPSLHGFWTFI